jgi:hypothetical protein
MGSGKVLVCNDTDIFQYDSMYEAVAVNRSGLAHQAHINMFADAKPEVVYRAFKSFAPSAMDNYQFSQHRHTSEIPRRETRDQVLTVLPVIRSYASQTLW